MLRMSKLADYAFVILSHMAVRKTQVWPASVIAFETSLPLPTVAKLMKMMARKGIVTAQRGALGGYTLAMEAEDISIAKIIEAVDGPITLTECAGEVKGEPCDCLAKGDCPVREGWAKVNSAIRGALESVNLSDLVPEKTFA